MVSLSRVLIGVSVAALMVSSAQLYGDVSGAISSAQQVAYGPGSDPTAQWGWIIWSFIFAFAQGLSIVGGTCALLDAAQRRERLWTAFLLTMIVLYLCDVMGPAYALVCNLAYPACQSSPTSPGSPQVEQALVTALSVTTRVLILLLPLAAVGYYVQRLAPASFKDGQTDLEGGGEMGLIRSSLDGAPEDTAPHR